MNTYLTTEPETSGAGSGLKALFKQCERSECLFASPIHVGVEDAPLEWMPRFSLLGAGRHEHGTLLGLLAGLGRRDPAATAFALQALDRWAALGDETFPDLIAYPDLSSAGSVEGPAAGPDLLAVNWLDQGDRRVTALIRDFQDLRFDGFLTLRSRRDIEQPRIQVSGLPVDLLQDFDQNQWFLWQPLCENGRAAPDGPLSAGALLPRVAFELRILLPTSWKRREEADRTIEALRKLLLRYATYAIHGYGI